MFNKETIKKYLQEAANDAVKPAREMIPPDQAKIMGEFKKFADWTRMPPNMCTLAYEKEFPTKSGVNLHVGIYYNAEKKVLAVILTQNSRNISKKYNVKTVAEAVAEANNMVKAWASRDLKEPIAEASSGMHPNGFRTHHDTYKEAIEGALKWATREGYVYRDSELPSSLWTNAPKEGKKMISQPINLYLTNAVKKNVPVAKLTIYVYNRGTDTLGFELSPYIDLDES